VLDLVDQRRFEQALMPHLDAAYNLARWLTGDGHDAEDVVQEAYCRAVKYFHAFRGDDGRTWLLKIVRHTCYTWLQKNRSRAPEASFDEQRHGEAPDSFNPEKLAVERADQEMVRRGLEALPVEYREALVLRELEGLSYHDIAEVAGIPLGTVMSRLARGRKQLQQVLAGTREES
jgi:RNA polymerase sigma-70 factor (ECF subfamily)